MTKATVVSILTGTWRPKGGMTSSVLLRSSRFVEYGVRSIIFTLDYRADQTDYVANMRRNGSVAHGVDIRNFYEDLRATSIDDGNVSMEERVQLFEQVQDIDLSRFFSVDGELVYNERKSSDGSRIRKFFNDQRQVIRIDEISPLGSLHRRKLRSADRGKFTQITYLNRLGGAYALSWLNDMEEESGFFVYNGNSTDISFYKRTREAQISWVRDQVEQIDGPVVLIVDNPEIMDIVNQISGANIKKVVVFHGNHLMEPNDPSSGLRAVYKPVLNNAGRWDRLVCSTHKQAEHLEAVVGSSVQIDVIPQAIDDHPSRPNSSKLDSSFAFFGRLVDLKRLPEIIKAFSKVLAVRPDARLDIFGEGQAREQLRQVVRDLALEDAVSLKGAVSDVRSHMVRYTATLLCSAHEGFGLVIGESMISSTPVIATDCNYGPSEIITLDSGILVEHNDFDAVAEAMIWCIDNPGDLHRMGNRARVRILENFSRESVSDSWLELLDNLL
ncbi:glycosyltransferase [Paeniglutamicibacter gangotriensis]|uniref:glycosyltransferase n=1 Tax=Paeniglutamicibacter gangotriensis TaxID=254787 RepID=UPI0037CA21F9